MGLQQTEPQQLFGIHLLLVFLRVVLALARVQHLSLHQSVVDVEDAVRIALQIRVVRHHDHRDPLLPITLPGRTSRDSAREGCSSPQSLFGYPGHPSAHPAEGYQDRSLMRGQSSPVAARLRLAPTGGDAHGPAAPRRSAAAMHVGAVPPCFACWRAAWAASHSRSNPAWRQG